MRYTGIVRRVDDLGRILIPREVRRAVRIHEGDPFEIAYDENGVYFEKYNVNEGLMEQIQSVLQAVKTDDDIENGKRAEVSKYLQLAVDALNSPT